VLNTPSPTLALNDARALSFFQEGKLRTSRCGHTQIAIRRAAEGNRGWVARVRQQSRPCSPPLLVLETSLSALSQLAWAHTKAVTIRLAGASPRSRDYQQGRLLRRVELFRIRNYRMSQPLGLRFRLVLTEGDAEQLEWQMS
jgi:hypothetical protein